MKNTKQKIQKVAFNLLVKNGYDGVSFQDIADKAGVTKAMLNYYFRNKENLLNVIFIETLEKYLLPNFEILTTDMPIEEQMKQFIDKTIDTFVHNPQIPLFIANEISHHPKIIRKSFTKFQQEHLSGILDNFRKRLRTELNVSEEKLSNPTLIITDMISLILFPFIIRTGLLELCMEGSVNEFKELMKLKKQHISELIVLYINSLK